MNFLILAEIIAGYFILATGLCMLVLACVIHWRGSDPLLLDGRPLLSALDEHAHERLTLDRALAEDRAVAALDAVWALPARSHD